MMSPGNIVVSVHQMTREDFALHIKHRHPMLQLLRAQALKRAHEQKTEEHTSELQSH